MNALDSLTAASCIHCGRRGPNVRYDCRYVGGQGYVNGYQCASGCDRKPRTVAEVTRDGEYDRSEPRGWSEDEFGAKFQALWDAWDSGWRADASEHTARCERSAHFQGNR